MTSSEAEKGPTDRSAILQARVRGLTELYEREAFRTYNLALRINTEPDRAQAAAEQAFLAAGDAREPASVLVPAVVRGALAGARRRPHPRGAGGEEANRLLAAVAKLAPSERAAVVLGAVERLDAATIGSILELPAAKAAQLMERGDERLARELRVTGTELAVLLSTWPWTEPPRELWESIYTRFYAAAQRQLDAGERAGVTARSAGRGGVAGLLSPARGRRALAAVRTWSWRRRLVTLGMVAALVVGLTALRASEAPDETSAQLGSPYGDPAALGESADDGGDGNADGDEYDPLTPEELDELRKREIEQVKRLQEKQADDALSDQVREQAAARAEAILQRERQRQSGSGAKKQRSGERTGGGGSKTNRQPEPDPAPAPKPKPDGGGGGGSGGGDSGGSGDKSGGSDDGKSGGGGSGGGGGKDISKCLYDDERQSYICPQ